jgi:hypothetical protein
MVSPLSYYKYNQTLKINPGWISIIINLSGIILGERTSFLYGKDVRLFALELREGGTCADAGFHAVKRTVPRLLVLVGGEGFELG